MLIQTIGRITTGNIPIFHAKSKTPPKFRAALMQTEFSNVDFAASALRHEELVTALMAQTVKPDLILFPESSLFGGSDILCDYMTVQAGKALVMLSKLAQDLNIHIGFGTARKFEKHVYNSYAVVFPQANKEPFFCDKFSTLNQRLAQGTPYAYLAKFNAMVSMCADIPLLSQALFHERVAKNFSFLIVPASTTAEGTRGLLHPRSIGFTDPIVIINNASGGNSIYSPDTRSHISLHQNQEEVLLVDVVV